MERWDLNFYTTTTESEEFNPASKSTFSYNDEGNLVEKRQISFTKPVLSSKRS